MSKKAKVANAKTTNGEPKPQTKRSKDAESESGPTLRLSLDDIFIDYDFNARKRDAKSGEYPAVKGIGVSMLEEGQLQAVTVMRMTLEMRKETNSQLPFFLVFGFTRCDAARALNWKEIKATVGEWDSISVARRAAMAENIAREDLAPYDNAVALHDILEKDGCSVRDLAKSIGKNHAYISELTNLVKVGNPMILRCWRDNHKKATIANLNDVIWDVKRRDSHAKQMQAWMVLTCQVTDENGGEDSNEEGSDGDKGSSPQTPDEIKRPTVKTILRALEAVKRSEASAEYLKGVTAALRFAGVKSKTIAFVWTQKVQDEIEAEEKAEKDAEKEAEKQAKVDEKAAKALARENSE